MPLFIEWFTQLSISVLLLWGIGLAVVALLAPRIYRRDALLVAPFFGLGTISAMCHYLGALGMPARQFAWGMFLASLAALAGVIIRGRPWAGLRRHWTVLAVCLATYLLAVLPLIYLGYLTTVGTLTDGISYAVRSEYLQEAGLVMPARPPGHPFYGWVAFQIDTVRAGDVYFLAVVGVLSGARSYQLLTTTAALFFALTPASVYVLSRRTFHLKSPAALLAAGLVGLHNLVLWPVYNNFFSQTVAVSLFPVLLSFGLKAVRTCRWRETVGFAILFATLLSVYPSYALPIGAACVLCAGVDLVRQAQPAWRQAIAPAKRYLVWAGLAAVATVAWNGVVTWRALNELSFVGRVLDPSQVTVVGGGDIDVFPPVFEIPGLIAHASAAYDLNAWQLPPLVLGGATLVAAAWVVLGWWRLRPGGRPAAAIAALTLIGLVLQQRFGVNPPQGYPYGYFKIISLLTVTLLPLLAHGVGQLLARPRLRHVTWPLLLGLVLVNGINTAWTIHYALRERVAVTREAIEIAQGLHRVPADEWILLDLVPGIQQHWIGYLLKDHTIHYREPLFTQNVFDHAYPLPAYQYALVQRSLDSRRAGTVFDEPWYTPGKYTVLWSNPVYELRQRTDGVLADLYVSADRDDWDSRQELRIEMDQAGRRLRERTGAAPAFDAALAGRPRTLQVTLLVLTRTAAIQVGLVRLELTSGVWTVDIAAADLDHISLKNVGNTSILVYRIRALAVDTGGPARFVEIDQRLEGAAYATQRIGPASLEYQVTLLRPREDDTSIYRLGLHVFDPDAYRSLGVWGLDFDAPKRLQHGRLYINLQNRTAQGVVQDEPVSVDLGVHETETGHFEVQAVWWRLGQPFYLSLFSSADFTRAAGRVRWGSSSEIPPTILVFGKVPK